MSCLDLAGWFAYLTTPAMKPRPVGVAIVHCPATKRVLLITSRKHPKYWILPKGGVEKGETPGEAAAREANEEAGIPASIPEASISAELITLHEAKPHGAETWHVHAIELQSEKDLDADWKERHERKRQWVTHREALKLMRAWEGKLQAEEPAGVYYAPEDEADAWKRGGSKKRRAKGRAFEKALHAFVEKFGYDDLPDSDGELDEKSAL